jgi:hypothetical protein
MRLPGCVRDMQGWSTSSHNDLTLILPLSLSLSFMRRRAHPNGKLSRSLASHPTNDSVGGSCPPRVPLTPPAAAAGRFVAPSYSYVTCTRARQRKEAGLRVLVYQRTAFPTCVPNELHVTMSMRDAHAWVSSWTLPPGSAWETVSSVSF